MDVPNKGSVTIKSHGFLSEEEMENIESKLSEIGYSEVVFEWHENFCPAEKLLCKHSVKSVCQKTLAPHFNFERCPCPSQIMMVK